MHARGWPAHLARRQIVSPLFQAFLRDESAATAIEYGLIASLIALVCITALTQIGTSLNATFETVSNALR
jgi:pilus assembly protein Flp/PilA